MNAHNEEKSKDTKLDKLLKSIQILAVVGAAGWTVYVFSIVEEKQRELAERQSEINLKQSMIAAKQMEMLAPVEQRLKVLEAEKAEDEAQARREAATLAPIVGKGELTLECSKIASRSVNYQLVLTNPTKRRTELSWVVFIRYVGTYMPSGGPDRLDDVDLPPLKLYSEKDSSHVKWTQAGSVFYGRATARFAELLNLDRVDARTKGYPHKQMPPGDTLVLKETYYFQPKRANLIAMVVLYAVDGGHGGKTVYYFKHWRPVEPCPDGSSQAVPGIRP